MNSNWSYSLETPNLGPIGRFLEPCDLEIWRMTFKYNRAPLLCCFKLCAWFHCRMWIQTGVRVRKWLSWVLTYVTLTFDLWPWPSAWTSLLTMVITPENFMMIRWWEHGEKGVTDGQTDRREDGQTDGLNQSYSCLVAAKKALHAKTESSCPYHSDWPSCSAPDSNVSVDVDLIICPSVPGVPSIADVLPHVLSDPLSVPDFSAE